LSYQQLAGVTAQQIRDQFPDAKLSATFIKKVKALLLRRAQRMEDEENLQRLKTQAWDWLRANFPDIEAEITRQSGKPCVTLWLKGRPEDVD